MGKIFQKKKWFRGRHTTEEERRKKKVWPINHININHHHGESVAGRLESAVRHAARVRRRIAFVVERMRTTTSTTTTTIVFRRLFFCFPFLLTARSYHHFHRRFRLSLFFVCCVSSNRVRRVLSLVFFGEERCVAKTERRVGGRRSVGVGVRGDSRVLNANYSIVIISIIIIIIFFTGT